MRRDETGGASVELAMVLPALIACIGAVIMAGWLGTTQAILQHGAREGARAAAIPSSADLRSWPNEAALTTAVDAATPLLTPSDVVLSGQTGGSNSDVVVEVSYQVTNPFSVLLAPLRLMGVDEPVSPTMTFTATARGRRE